MPGFFSSLATALLFGVLSVGTGGAITTADQAPAAPGVIDLGKSLDDLIAAKGHASDSERLRALFDEFWRYSMLQDPETATRVGYPGRNDRWSDLSEEALARRRALLPKLLAAVGSINRSALSETERTNYDLFRRREQMEVEGSRFPVELLAVSQLGGVQTEVPELLANMPAGNVEQYEDILARLRGVPRLLGQTITLLEQGLAMGVTPPRVTLSDVPAQVSALLPDEPLQSPVLSPFRDFPGAIDAADQERLRREAVRIYSREVAPALRKLHDFLESTYLPGARTSIAASALPDGEAWYAFGVREVTTTDLTPRQVHALGLAEVKRIRREMDELVARIGFKGTQTEFQNFLRNDSRFYYERPEDLLVGFRDLCKRIDPELVKLFGKLPRLPYGVEPVPAIAEKSQPAAYYNPGSLAAGRPGIFYVNTYDLRSRPKWKMEALALHEAVPGHHLQTSLAQELEEAPAWRRYDSYAAFVEGWGLYSESLGAELGLYKDPYSRFGQLTNEMWRAIRLVLDTGIHAMGWTRQRAIDYAKENVPAKTEHEITVEVDRYISIPAQALAYTIGELKIRELRAYAEKELGARFALRAFHDRVLSRGAVPLDMLEADIKWWVEQRKMAATRAGTGAP